MPEGQGKTNSTLAPQLGAGQESIMREAEQTSSSVEEFDRQFKPSEWLERNA
jgi:hypothetical protein